MIHCQRVAADGKVLDILGTGLQMNTLILDTMVTSASMNEDGGRVFLVCWAI